ncbi:hypothetical protein F8S13_24070 [Chloroflexia bacterium SDU3-3]|nr:hypothetical protein F8S13_24070 [Chloroflexia bacterium SDU3-3]
MGEQRQELPAQEIGSRKETRRARYTYQPPQPPDIFYRFLFGHVTAQELGRFIYQADTRAAYVGALWEDELLAFPFHVPDADQRLRQLIMTIIRDLPTTQDNEPRFRRAELVRSIHDLQQNRTPLYEGAAAIWTMGYQFFEDYSNDPDFRVFWGIAVIFEIWQEEGVATPELFYRDTIAQTWGDARDDLASACQGLLRSYDPYYA